MGVAAMSRRRPMGGLTSTAHEAAWHRHLIQTNRYPTGTTGAERMHPVWTALRLRCRNVLELPLRAIRCRRAVVSIRTLIALKPASASRGRRHATRTAAAAAATTATASAVAFRATLAAGQRVGVIQLDIRKWATILVEDNDMGAVAPISAVAAISPVAASATDAAVAAVARGGIILTPLP